MFVYLDSALNAEFVDMHMVCLHTTLHISSGWFIIVIKPKPKDGFHSAVALLPYTEKEPYQSYLT
jgi:hypothetical protein